MEHTAVTLWKQYVYTQALFVPIIVVVFVLLQFLSTLFSGYFLYAPLTLLSIFTIFGNVLFVLHWVTATLLYSSVSYLLFRRIQTYARKQESIVMPIFYLVISVLLLSLIHISLVAYISMNVEYGKGYDDIGYYADFFELCLFAGSPILYSFFSGLLIKKLRPLK